MKIGTLRIIKEDRPTCEGFVRLKKELPYESDISKLIGSTHYSVNMSQHMFEYWEPVQPIIICDDEINVGDYAYSEEEDRIFICGKSEDVLLKILKKGKKILVLSSQIYPEDIHGLKDGDKIEVETGLVDVKGSILRMASHELKVKLKNDAAIIRIHKQSTDEAAKSCASEWAAYTETKIAMDAFKAGVNWYINNKS